MSRYLNENQNQQQRKPLDRVRTFGKEIQNQVNNNQNQSFQQQDIHTVNPSLPARKAFDLVNRQQSQPRPGQNNFRSQVDPKTHEFQRKPVDAKRKNLRPPSANEKIQKLQDFKRYMYDYYTQPNSDLLEVDQFDIDNSQSVSEFAADCQRHMQRTEMIYYPSPNLMSKQKDINKKMRLILVGWLLEVHLKFKLLPETLFLTINLIDRYSEQKQIQRTKYQLLGVTAMLIASKYEEIYAPEIRDFVYITDKAYTKEEILAQESDILQTLDFNITTPSSYRFLERFTKLAEADNLIFNYARYLIEFCLYDLKMYKYPPSQITAAAIYIAKKMLKRANAWSLYMIENTGYNERKVRDCAKDICQLLNQASKKDYEQVYNKFCLDKFMEVAKISPSNSYSGRSTSSHTQKS
eukprot:403338720